MTSAMNRLIRRLQRLRHRKGFGVHSPFAFSLIVDVTGSPGHYYGDDMLRDLVGARHGEVRCRAWLLHRLVARLDPTVVVLPSGTPQMLADAVKIARTDRPPVESLPAGKLRDVMLVADCGWLAVHDEETDRLLTSPGCTLMAYGSYADISCLSVLAAEKMPGGWILADRRTAIYISSARTPLQSYDVKLT